jgi:hypothetical protein
LISDLEIRLSLNSSRTARKSQPRMNTD